MVFMSSAYGYANGDRKGDGASKVTVHSLYLEEEAGNDRTFYSVRDDSGFLWIATDNGLKRYDGYHLRRFTNDPKDPLSIGSNLITYLMVQKNGALWASGLNLSEYIPETESFNVYDVSDGATIWCMYEDDQGILWFGGEGFGLRGFDLTERRVVYEYFNDTKGNFITAAERHGYSSSIWLATTAGLFLFDTATHKKEQYELPADLESGVDNIRGLTEDRSGNLWIAAQDGLFVLNPNTRKTKHYVADESDPNSLMTNVLWSVFEDSAGHIWIGTDKKGVDRYLPKTDSFFHIEASEANPYAFPPGSMYGISEDDEGTLWFASAGYGLRRVSEHLEKFTAFKHSDKDEQGIGFNNILDLHEDKQGDIWIATDGGGLDRYNPTTGIFTHYRNRPDDPESISSDSVLSIAEDAEGYIWIGTWGGGVNRLDPKTGKFWHMKVDPKIKDGQTLGHNDVFRIEIDKQGLLYLSLWRVGLQIYNPKDNSFKSYFTRAQEDAKSGITNFSINDFEMAPNGVVWIGGHAGLEYFDPETEIFVFVDLPGVEAIFDLYLDSSNILWLATSKNLLRYDTQTKKIKTYVVEDGLADNFVSSIEADNQGYLWLGTRHGLNRFDPITDTFQSFDESDGLAGSQFNRFSHLLTRSGKMYFGGSDGLTFFDPQYLPQNEFAPQVHLTSLELFETPVIPGETPWLDRHIDLVDKLVLPYNQRDITFEFTALNYVSPNKNRYRYRLKGWEDNWIDVDSSRRRVRYTNLDSGRYTFQVLGSNNEDVWSVKAKEIELVILPAWWNTWWARIVFLASLLLLIYIFVSWRLRSNKKLQKNLEKMVNEKTAELESANIIVSELNADLESRVEKRTKELSVEIEERQLVEAKLFHMAFHDVLTGLPNRSWLMQHLEGLILRSASEDFKYALFFLDGDRFKKVNDTHGHLMGDMLLKASTDRLKDLSPLGHNVVRLGGDEFTIVIDSIESEEQVETLAKKIIQSFNEPFIFDQTQIIFRVSIGMLVCEKEYTKPEQILRDADIAMYRAKERGRGNYQMFDNKMLESTLAIAELEADLYQALEKNQFSVVFQPIIRLEPGTLSGFEVLLRWYHPDRGLIPPDKFIPIAEDIGVILDVGLWVLKQACLQQKQWEEDLNLEQMPSIAVNLSPLQLAQPDLIEKIDQVLESTGADSRNIKLEITESALMENTDTVDQLLGALRERDIELAIDDFGTGYSSLSYLDKLPVQVLKIDRSFVASLIDEGDDRGSAQEIVKATISLAHNLKIEVVAEGIETQAQMDLLKSFRCDFGQGYLMACPLSSEDATNFLIKSISCQSHDF